MANISYDEDRFFDDPDLVTYTPIPFTARCKKLWRRSDLYAIPITLRYKGEKAFYTNYGALISNIVILTLMGFTFSLIHNMLGGEYTSIAAEKLIEYKPPDQICTNST